MHIYSTSRDTRASIYLSCCSAIFYLFNAVKYMIEILGLYLGLQPDQILIPRLQLLKIRVKNTLSLPRKEYSR